MSSELDQGLEKIPAEMRLYAWKSAKQSSGEQSWKAFFNVVSQNKFGGVSSMAEAQRLFFAEQIANRTFFYPDLLPSLMSESLSNDIQNGFQHNSKPISAKNDQNEAMMEILNYYFPSDKALKNFELALSGQLDEEAKQQFNFIQSNESNFDFEEDFEMNDEFSSNNIEPIQENSMNFAMKAQPQESEFEKERPKLKTYLNFKLGKNQSSTNPDLAPKIKRIVDDYYFN